MALFPWLRSPQHRHRRYIAPLAGVGLVSVISTFAYRTCAGHDDGFPCDQTNQCARGLICAEVRAEGSKHAEGRVCTKPCMSDGECQSGRVCRETIERHVGPRGGDLRDHARACLGK